MATITVTEKLTEKGQLQINKDDIKRTYTKQYQAITDSLTLTPIDILTATGVPRIGAAYTGDTGVCCTSVSPTQREDAPYVWDVEVQYTVPDKEDPDKPDPPDPTNPGDWMESLEIGWVKRTVYCEKDKNGNPIQNSAGEPYRPPATMDREDLRITVTRWEPTLAIMTIIGNNNTVNSVQVMGCVAAGTGKLSISASRERKNDAIWYRKSYTIEVNPDGWNLKPLDKGLLHAVDANGNECTSVWPPDVRRLQICDFHGIPVKGPQFLNGHGGLLAPGAAPVITLWADDAEFVERQPAYEKPKRAFARLRVTPGIGLSRRVSCYGRPCSTVMNGPQQVAQ